MSVTLRQVQIFLAVAREMHFARAAEVLHLSQPTVSQEVRRLERALGVPLFDRTTRSASLTVAGAELLTDCQRLVDSADRLVQKAARLTPERANTLRVVASPSIVNRLLPEVVGESERRLPMLRVEDVLVDTGGVGAALEARGGDIGLGRFLPTLNGYKKETLVYEPVMATLSARHPLAGAEAISLADLGDLPLLLWPREQNREYYDELISVCRERELAPLILVSPPLIVGSRSYLIAEGRAFSLVPRSATNHLSPDLKAVSLVAPASLPLEMLYPAGDPRDYVPPFLEIVREKALGLG